MPSLLARMSNDTAFSERDLMYLIATAPKRYKVYQIPKRRSAGMRTIAQPALEVKVLQHWTMENVLARFPIHDAATAYKKGASIGRNAQRHSRNSFILKMDFRDFFPSIKPRDFLLHCAEVKTTDYSEQELQMLVKILFWQPKYHSELRLSIGAPSSPALSNTVMYQFDKQVNDVCVPMNVVYTRYADDLVFSTSKPNILKAVFVEVQKISASLEYPRLSFNEQKTVYTSRAHRRRVTGLILANDGKVSLGRERKRQIRSMVHHYSVGGLSEEGIGKLRGLLSFSKDVEPDFFARLQVRYGGEMLRRILTMGPGKQRG